MAARENQGLQIALIIFVMLSIMLSVTTFLFLRNYQTEQEKFKNEQAASTKLKADLQTVQGEREEFVRYMGGYPGTEKETTIKENWEKDMNAAAPFGIANLPDEQKTYRKLVESLQAVVRAKNVQLSKEDADLRDARDTLAKKTAEFAAQKKQLEDDKKKAVDDYLAERDRINKQLTDVRATEGELTARNAAKDKELETVKTQAQGKIGDLEKALTKSETHGTQLREHLNELEQEFNVNAQPSGKIVWVNQRENVVYINLGSDDNLRKRITFSVYEPATTDVSATNPSTPTVSKAVSKGSIEVINILDRHTAECRILKDLPSKPLLPGDLIFTPVWRPGQQDHFALVGVMDINGDGADDRQRVHDVISMNRGIVDAEIGADGKAIGTISLNTRYVVVGDLTTAGKSTDGSYKLLEEAKKYNVETITLNKFMDMMGYTAKAGSVGLAPENIIRGVPAGTPAGGFRPRMPPRTPTGG